MKKIILLFIVSIFCCSSIYAQEETIDTPEILMEDADLEPEPVPAPPSPPPAPKVEQIEEEVDDKKFDFEIDVESIRDNHRFGLALTPTISWLRIKSNEIEAKRGRFSVGYGLVIERYFAKNGHFGISSGLMCTPVGGRYQAPDPTNEITLRIRYWEIPFMFKYRTNQLGYFTYTAQLGITGGLATSTRYDQPSNSIEDAKARKLTQPLNFTWGGGVGIEYALGEKLAAFGGLFYHSTWFNAVTDDDGKKITPANIGIRGGIFF